MQDAYDHTLLNTSLFSYNKQVLISEKNTLCQCLNLENFVKKTLADVRVRSDGQGNVSGFPIFIAIIPSRLLCQIGTLSRFRKRKKISSLLVYFLHKT